MENESMTVSDLLKTNDSTTPSKDIPVTVDDDFDYDGYQVVRGEFFSHIFEPSFTVNRGKVSVNSACLNMLPNVDYIQILVNKEEKKLAVKPCSEEDKDSFKWATSGKKRAPRQIPCKIFFAKIMELMQWEPDFRYKMLGKLIKARGEMLFIFDLTNPVIYIRTTEQDGKIKLARKPTYPVEWQSQFGVPFKDHQNCVQVSIFKGYAVFGMTHSDEENKNESKPETNELQDESSNIDRHEIQEDKNPQKELALTQ